MDHRTGRARADGGTRRPGAPTEAVDEPVPGYVFVIAVAALLALLLLATSPRGPVCSSDEFRANSLDAYQAVGTYLVDRAC